MNKDMGRFYGPSVPKQAHETGEPPPVAPFRLGGKVINGGQGRVTPIQCHVSPRNPELKKQPLLTNHQSMVSTVTPGPLLGISRPPPNYHIISTPKCE